MSDPEERAERGSLPVEDVLRTWRDEPVPPDAEPTSERRRQVVGRMAALIRQSAEVRAHASRRRRRLAALAAAAALALGIGAAWRGFAIGGNEPARTAAAPASPDRVRAEAGDVVVVHADERRLAAVGGELEVAPGDEVNTGPEARAIVELARVANVEAAAATRLRLLETAETGSPEARRIGLVTGEVSVRVPKLAAGQSFGVRAPDAEVIVRGTAFRVAVRPASEGAASVTSVWVAEGRVLVRHATGEIELGAGQRWTSEATAEVLGDETVGQPDTSARVAPSASPSVSASTSTSSTAGAPPRGGASAGSPASEEAKASQLAEQNRLFQAAMANKRRGDDRATVAVLDELMAKHPGSPLAQEARVERMRALARLGDHAAAARDARRYLAEHQDGFARDEAKQLAVPASAAPSAGKPAP